MNLNQRRQHLLLVSSPFLLASILLATVNHAPRSGNTLHEVLNTLRQIQSILDHHYGYDHVPKFKDQPAVLEPTGVLVGLGSFAVTMCFFLCTEYMEFIRTQQLFEYWVVAGGMGLLALLVTYNEIVWPQRFLGLFFVCYVVAQYAERGQERRQKDRRLAV